MAVTQSSGKHTEWIFVPLARQAAGLGVDRSLVACAIRQHSARGLAQSKTWREFLGASDAGSSTALGHTRANAPS